MSPFFDDLEAQLQAAARAHGPATNARYRDRGRRRIAVVLRAVPVGLAVVCALAIALLGVVSGVPPTARSSK